MHFHMLSYSCKHAIYTLHTTHSKPLEYSNPELGTRLCFLLRDTATARQRIRALVTRQKVLRLRCLTEVATRNILYTKQQFIGQKTWSRCRGRVVACAQLISYQYAYVVCTYILKFCLKKSWRICPSIEGF